MIHLTLYPQLRLTTPQKAGAAYSLLLQRQAHLLNELAGEPFAPRSVTSLRKKELRDIHHVLRKFERTIEKRHYISPSEDCI